MATIAFTTYQLAAFDSDKAKAGSLVAMVNSNTSETASFSTDEIGTGFKGVGVCVYAGSNSLTLTIDGDTFYFTETGTPGTSHSNGYKLLMASIKETVYTAGNAATGTQTNTVTRSSTGNVFVGDTTTEASTVLIDSLNVRDKFALSALNSIISKMGQDPATLSDASISYYCSQAYRYAAYMMASSASARSTFQDQTTATGEASVNELDSNTDKLLNNLIVELKRTDVEEKDGDTSTYYKNIKMAQVDDILASLNTSTAQLEAMKIVMNNSLDKLSEYIFTQTGYINTIGGATTAIRAGIDSMSNRTNEQTTHIKNVAERIQELVEKQGLATTSMSSIYNALNNITTALTNINSSIASLNTSQSNA